MTTSRSRAVKVALFGAGGRMGHEIIAAVKASAACDLVAAVDRTDSDDLGRDVGQVAGGAAIGIALSSDVTAAAKAADVLIDFSSPAGFADALEASRVAGCAFVCGTTGLDSSSDESLAQASRDIPVLYASNMTFGMAVLNRLTAQAARMLGSDFDAEILEMHHRYKKDAPSGSALRLGESIATARGTTLEASGEFGRHGAALRKTDSIGFASLRGGDVAGDHTVIFAADGERLELTFRASDRRIFAKGAVRAAAWLVEQPTGRYTIDDMLES